jgi:hypothetical protein
MESDDSNGSIDYLDLQRPNENFDLALFNGLRAKYPADMTVLDIVVCREIYTNRLDEHPAHYEEIVARLMHETLEDLPCDVWPQFVFEAREYSGFKCTDSLGDACKMVQIGLEEKGEERMEKFKLFRIERDACRAIDKANKKGFVQYELHEWGIAEHPGDCKEFVWVPIVDVKLHDDILEELVEIDRRFSY